MTSCVCCGVTSKEFRRDYPYQAKIVKENVYGLPVGKTFPFARRKERDGVLVRENWWGDPPAYFHGQEYHLREDEVMLEWVPV